MATDIIIPLGNGSKCGNDELRILLRSIERNAQGTGTVCIVSDCAPDWLANCRVVECGDAWPHNKDANMTDKMLAAIAEIQCREFILTCDDTVFNKPCDLERLPVIYNNRSQKDFGPDFARGEWRRWHQRMYHTFWLAEQMGVTLCHNYECHAPQRFDARRFADNLRQIDYYAGTGFGIFTLLRLCEGITGGEDQNAYKTTHERREDADRPMDRLFVGYNDEAFCNGLRERLYKAFPDKSKYER